MTGDTATGIWYLQDRVIVAEVHFMLIGAAFYDQYRRRPAAAGGSAPATTEPTRRQCVGGHNFNIEPGALAGRT